jgi:D-alanyl-D-alanine carboxypeptidase (penicillin-binding protein 5/6)
VCLPQYTFADQQVNSLRLTSVSALLMNADTGDILYSQNPNFRIQPASLTKVMTLFIAFDTFNKKRILVDEKVEISNEAAQKGGSTMYLRESQIISYSELLKGIAVVSGNDACIALAEGLHKSEQKIDGTYQKYSGLNIVYKGVPKFIKMMNQKVKDLKIKNTIFQTVDGWPAPDQYTTAYDMAIIAQAYIREHPEALKYHKLKEFIHNSITLHNRNGLVFQDQSVDGLKTGHIEDAGYHLIATAKKHNKRLIAIVMGAKSVEIREIEAMQLLNFGFNNFVNLKLFDKDDVLTHLLVSNGRKGRVGIKPHEDGIIQTHISQKEHIALLIKSKDKYEAPIQKGQELAYALITDNNKILKSIPLYAIEEIQQVNFVTIVLSIYQRTISNKKIIVIFLIFIISLAIYQLLRTKKQTKHNLHGRKHDDSVVKKRLNKITEASETN